MEEKMIYLSVSVYLQDNSVLSPPGLISMFLSISFPLSFVPSPGNTGSRCFLSVSWINLICYLELKFFPFSTDFPPHLEASSLLHSLFRGVNHYHSVELHSLPRVTTMCCCCRCCWDNVISSLIRIVKKIQPVRKYSCRGVFERSLPLIQRVLLYCFA